MEWSHSTTLKIHKSNEGSYHCVISNSAGSQASTAAKLSIADPPRVTIHPNALKDAVPGQPVTFTVHATGTEPMKYQWQWKPAGEEGESAEWQLCDLKWCNGNTLSVPSIQKSNEGSYQCIISNCAGSRISKEANLSVADPPCITTHPKRIKDAVPGQPVAFAVSATGTEPISYQWRWTLVGSGDESEREEWQWCDEKRSDSHTLTIPSVQKSNEGSYHCVVSNCAGSQYSDPAILSVAEPPRITNHPQDVKDVAPGKPVNFTIGTTGTEPLSCQWQWKPAGEEGGSEEWQLCDMEGPQTAVLSIPSVQKSNEGQYCCNISNCAGSQISEPAILSVADPPWNWVGNQISKSEKLSTVDLPRITSHPKQLNGVVAGKPATFIVQVTGTQPLSYLWKHKPRSGIEGWQVCEMERFPGADSSTLTIPSVQMLNEGSYLCTVSNCAGSVTSAYATLTVAAELVDLVNELQEVNNWIHFGLNLGIKISRLKAIEKDYHTINDCRRELLAEWQQQEVPTWSAVVKALMAIGMGRLASEIAQKHGIQVPVPEPPDDELLEQLSNLSHQGEAIRPVLFADVQKHSEDIRKVVIKIKDARKHLRDSESSKANIDENINQLLHSISKLWDKVQRIAHERNITKEKLEAKQREYQLLFDVPTFSMHDSKKRHHRFWKKDRKRHEKDRQLQDREMLLEEKIAKKRKKIEKLEEELQQKDSDLQSAQQEARTLEKKLLEAREELEMKCEEVKKLQKENEELTCSYNIEKERVSKLVQVRVALTADKKKIEQQLASTEDESWRKSQQIEACNSSITSLSEMVEALSCSLKEKEGAAAQLQSELQSSHQPVSSKTEQLLQLLHLQPQIVELGRKLQEAEYKQQQAVLEKTAVVQEVEAGKKFEAQLCAQLADPHSFTSHSKALKGAVADTPASLSTRVKSKSEACIRNELQLPLTLKWRQCRDMPCRMMELKSVTVGQKVFVGGGDTDLSGYDDEQCHTVYQYHPPTDQWERLTRYEYMYFAMAILTDKLTLVGGCTPQCKMTNQIAVWEAEGWTHPYPSMATPRYSPAVATYDRCLVVAGGMKLGVPLDSVEVLNTTSRQWLSTSPLPVKCYNMTSAIVNHELFLMGGTLTTGALTVSLPSAITNTSTKWHSIRAPPLEGSAAIAASGSVLAIGGFHGSIYNTAKAIYVYQPVTNDWKKVGDLPFARSNCSCTLLPSGEILIVGGRHSTGYTSRVDAAAF